MNLRIQTENAQRVFAPGERVRGACAWQLERPVKAIEVRLFWHCAGWQTEEVGVVATRRIDRPELTGHTSFDFVLPHEPYSYKGGLFSIEWMLEIVALAENEAESWELVVSPTGEPLGSIDIPSGQPLARTQRAAGGSYEFGRG